MKNAWKVVVVLGAAMVVLGVAAYLLSGRGSVTALIPSVFGVVAIGLGVAGRSGKRWALVSAGGWGLLGVAGPAVRLGPAIADGSVEWEIATVAQVVFVGLCVGLIGLAGWVLARGWMKQGEH